MRIVIGLNREEIDKALQMYVLNEKSLGVANAGEVQFQLEEQGEPLSQDVLLGASVMVEIAKPEKKAKK